MIRSRRPVVESLEDRLAPSTSGITWPDGNHLTLSFVPDDTQVGNYRSNLYQSLNATSCTGMYQGSALQ